MRIVSIQECSKKELSLFSCGNEKLDKYLKEFATKNDKSGYGKTFVLIDNKEIIGYYTLSTASITFDEMDEEYKKYNPRYPIPSVRIARLAINKNKQNKGYGKLLLKDAFLRIADVSNIVGVKLVIVDAKESSISFYTQFGFEKLKESSLTFFLPIDVLLKAIF